MCCEMREAWAGGSWRELAGVARELGTGSGWWAGRVGGVGGGGGGGGGGVGVVAVVVTSGWCW